MLLHGEPKARLNIEAKKFLNLYASLGERAENFLPNRIFESLQYFVKLCYEEPDDPVRQEKEINKYLLELKEAIPGYVDVSLMIFPHENSKAFEYSAKKQTFKKRLTHLMDIEYVDEKTKKQVQNILNAPDFSVGTPPVSQYTINFLYQILLGDKVRELRKFRDVIGVNGDVEEAQWNYLLDVMDQMVNQSTHYTTKAEKEHFLSRTESTVNFKGLNGFIRTIVSGTADTAVELIKNEIFSPETVKIIEYTSPDEVFETINSDSTSIFLVKIQHMRKNPFNEYRWFPLLSRIVFLDDSPESRATNTSLVFSFHNEIINTLNKVHTKKLGALANTQANLRLILDKVNTENLEKFRVAAEKKIKDFEAELVALKKEQLAEQNNQDQDIILFKFDEFARQIIKDKYILSKLKAYIELIQSIKNPVKNRQLNRQLIEEFEERTKAYFYSGNKSVHISTIFEGGGRNQIKTYGEYLLQRKLKPVKKEIIEKCRVILDVIPNNYERTLNNHFHKNFGLNLFLEKYKEYLTKAENEADNQGRFRNLLIDLGIEQKYYEKTEKEQDLIKEFISGLGNLEKTAIADDVQMIIRDLLFNPRQPNPFVFFNTQASWEYKDLFPAERFDLSPFDIDIELNEEGRIDYDRLHTKLVRIKSTFQLFDETGNLWDRFCENSTIIVNDPSNPTGFTDFNDLSLLKFLKFLSNCKITLFLDEAYNDAVKIEDPDEPKWRTISRYITNNISSYAKISVVSSLSTTKNLGATGDRLGSLIATPAKKEVIEFARGKFGAERGNTNSLFMLVNILETAQLAKKIKDRMDENLPKDASRYKIKEKLIDYIKDEIKANIPEKAAKNGGKIKRVSLFEGSPLHVFLLDELVSLDKLDVLELPDDFKYKGEAFFNYYKKHLVHELNQFRVNKIFRMESGHRLELAKAIANKVLTDEACDFAYMLDSHGSYLFNIVLKEFFSYQDLEKFTKKLAEQRGISVIPYSTGFIRFSLGDYIEGTEGSYQVYAKEFENALGIFLKYWKAFYALKTDPENKGIASDSLLERLFRVSSEKEFIQHVLEDFVLTRDLTRRRNQSIKISEIKTLYHAFPKVSGVSINSIGDSKNTVFEFYENIGECRDLTEFINSKAFTKVYENLLPQVYKKIPAIKNLDINTIIAKYGKPTLLKYVNSKLEYQPDAYLLDDPDEKLLMCEILIELENLLFSDAKVKILALNANESDPSGDLARLEGYNRILRKYIEELLLHFNLPFANEEKDPTHDELFTMAVEKFEEIIGKKAREVNLRVEVEAFLGSFKNYSAFSGIPGYEKLLADSEHFIRQFVFEPGIRSREKLFRYFQLQKDDFFIQRLERIRDKITPVLPNQEDLEEFLISKQVIEGMFQTLLSDISFELNKIRKVKIEQKELSSLTRDMVLYLTRLLNQTKSTEYYNKYNHYLMRMVEVEFRKQHSAINEMIQHGITLFRNFEMKEKVLETYDKGALSWINELMKRCGVIAEEQPVQTHTRIATDAKKREYPFHKIDRTEKESKVPVYEGSSPNDFIKNMKTRPSSGFFAQRMAKFIQNMDEDDYRCQIMKSGLVNELYIYQKSYIKYLTDNYRLIQPEKVTLEEVQHFVPDIVLFYGAPEKVISYPQIGYFDLKGPNGNIKTIVTPLKKSVDYFGGIKKPRLTMLNEKVKEKGGVPVHGSLFAVEEEDGSVFVIMISGDSGVGKSEMLAAMMLKWLKKDLPDIRSIKLIAGDMFHVFPDKEGNLYGVGTELGDFSRVTDFDPEYIKQYRSLFESSADSNVEDLNSRSTISGFCDISMPYKIDIMLTASNYSKDEAGVKRYANPENFLLYRDSHGERKEKATSSDNPNFQRTLLRYTGDKNIVEVLDQHGNYLDDILNWDKDDFTGRYFLSSSYKVVDKIDVEEVVNKIFKGRTFKQDGIVYQVRHVRFDIIKNRFRLEAKPLDSEEEPINFFIDRTFFSSIFNSLASTPAGNPFIDEEGELEIRQHLVNILKGGPEGKGNGRKIQCGILSTDLGKKGKEITGPQKAAEEVKRLIREVRIQRPEINKKKHYVKQLINEKYEKLFKQHQHSLEVWRYNFYLYQLEQMRKAEFVRIDNFNDPVDLSRLSGFHPLPKNHHFSPLLVTPNINIELNGFSETYEQLMWLPNNREFAEEFHQDCDQVYIAEGYPEDTIVNNMVVQLLLMNGYIAIEDLTRGKITEKANRETIAAAKFAAVRKMDDLKKKPARGKEPTEENPSKKGST